MRVKRYVADSIQEAIARVKNDLGRDAIILHTKPFKEGGFFGLFAHRRFEVIAAIDENTTENPPKKPENESIPQQTAINEIAAGAIVTEPIANVLPIPNEPALKSIRDEIAELKNMLRQVAVNNPGSNVPEIPDVLVELRDYLRNVELDEDVIDYLVLQCTNQFKNIEIVDWNKLLDFCRQMLINKLMFSEPIHYQPNVTKPQIIALIGPTGVGKTTTIAKLAANFNLFEGKKVGLITIDTYRIAAVEQLKTYGDIISLPVEVVYTPADLDQSLLNLQECDLILIDTAGRSPHNPVMIDDLQKFLNHPSISLILLVISATTRFRDMMSIAESFSRISYTHLVFTKLDETSSLGPIVSLALKIRRPIAYLTTGQNVPDDIEVAQSDKLISKIVKESTHG